MNDTSPILIPTPDAVPDGQTRAKLIREMFAQIAPRYDLANRILSASVDRLWRRRVVRLLSSKLEHPGSLALDLACGTADLSAALARKSKTIGCDFCHPMLLIGKAKVQNTKARVMLAEADALQLPFADCSFDAVTIAFGLRNLASISDGLSEMTRVLKPGGVLAILEFSKPSVPVLGSLFLFYFRRILPRLGRLISGSQFAYQYLPDSVSQFPAQQELVRMMAGAGLVDVKYVNVSGGIAAIHTGVRR